MGERPAAAHSRALRSSALSPLLSRPGGGTRPSSRRPRTQIFSSSKSSPANCRLTGGARSKARCGSSAPIAPSCSSRASPSPKSSCSDSLTLSAAGGKNQNGTRDFPELVTALASPSRTSLLCNRPTAKSRSGIYGKSPARSSEMRCGVRAGGLSVEAACGRRLHRYLRSRQRPNSRLRKRPAGSSNQEDDMRSVFEGFEANRGKSADDAGVYWTGGPVEVASRSWFVSNFSGVTAFETEAGLVLVDSGTERAAPGMAAQLREKTQAPVHTAIFTHGHLDHAYGLKFFLLPDQPRPRIVAQRAIIDRFSRYERTAGLNAGINARQFGPGPIADPATFRPPALMPDLLFDERLVFSAGDVTFEVFYCRGETDDACWVWCPERRVVCSGDLVINAVPNAGNPQKVQRYPWDWANGLRAIAACDALSLCPGHGGPVVQDSAKVKRLVLETADYLDSIVCQTLAALNDGAPPHIDIVHRVK